MVKRRDLIDAIADRVTITDLQGKILDVNQAVLDFHGRGRQEIVGRNFLDMVAAGDREMMRQAFQPKRWSGDFPASSNSRAFPPRARNPFPS